MPEEIDLPTYIEIMESISRALTEAASLHDINMTAPDDLLQCLARCVDAECDTRVKF